MSAMSAKPAYFNPLPRKEGDGIRDIVIPVSIGISIHSLVKRETKRFRH